MYRWKRIFVLVQKDLKSGLRDNIVLYSILAPLILAVLLTCAYAESLSPKE